MPRQPGLQPNRSLADRKGALNPKTNKPDASFFRKRGHSTAKLNQAPGWGIGFPILSGSGLSQEFLSVGCNEGALSETSCISTFGYCGHYAYSYC